MRLEQVSLTPPEGLTEFLADLADGENGFGGTSVHNGGVTLQEYLQNCCDQTDESKLDPGLVPQTIFWLLNLEGIVIGMAKIRHRLVERTRINGGHIGFFIQSAQRGKGYGKQLLTLALAELRRIGESRALVTVYAENTPSIRIVEANGGKLEDTIFDPLTKHDVNRYWIDLKP